MTNSDRDELVKLADDLSFSPSKEDGLVDLGCVTDVERDAIVTALRRLASSDGAVKGEPEPEPVAWPANLNPRTLDLVQRFALALAKKLRLAEEKYGHTDGWLRDDWEAECRDHLYQHLEKGDPRDVAAYCAFMWHHGWITYRPEPVASKRPVAFRVRQHRLSNYYELYTDEKDAQFWADDRGVDYEGLYLVADRYLAPPADVGMREALADLTDAFLSRHGCFPSDRTNDKERHWHRAMTRAYELVGQPDTPERQEALTAPGATTKSDGASERFVDSAYQIAEEMRKEDRPSDPSPTRSEVTVSVAELADWLFANLRSDTEPHQDASTLLDQFEIRRKS